MIITWNPQKTILSIKAPKIDVYLIELLSVQLPVCDEGWWSEGKACE